MSDNSHWPRFCGRAIKLGGGMAGYWHRRSAAERISPLYSQVSKDQRILSAAVNGLYITKASMHFNQHRRRTVNRFLAFYGQFR